MTIRHLFAILDFIESSMNVTLQHASSSNRGKIAKAQMRVISWLEVARAESVRHYAGIPYSPPPTPYLPKAPRTETTIINAALALAEDVFFLMRTKQMIFSKGMKTAWTRMLNALCSLFLIYDPDCADVVGQECGLALARRTWNAANRRCV